MIMWYRQLNRIDLTNRYDYDDLADPHGQSVLADRFIQRIRVYSSEYSPYA